MKRDMDLIRELLLKLEALDVEPAGTLVFHYGEDKMQVADYSLAQVQQHLLMLEEAGFIITNRDTTTFRTGSNIPFVRISWAGYDYLDAVRDPVVWSKTRSVIETVKGFTVDLVKQIASAVIKDGIGTYTGIRL